MSDNRTLFLVLAGAGGLVVGGLVGYTIGVGVGLDKATALRGGETFGQAMPPGMGGGMPPGMGSGLPAAPPPSAPGVMSPAQRSELEQAVERGKLITGKDPKNVQAWITLGNAYFDLARPQESIDAYGKALALEPNNPDVLTDQGAMYERTNDYDKALANFEKAQKVNPSHMQSLFNIGIIWRHKNDNAKAAAAWKQVIERAPGSPQAAQARTLLAEMGK